MTEKDINWKRMCFKNNKVWVASDGDDNLILNDGKALIKYQIKQNYEYNVYPDTLKPIDHADCKSASGKSKKIKKKSSEKPVLTEKTDSIPDNAIILYTDGASSGNPGPSGIGVLLRYGDHEKEISRYIGHGTNNIAELEAIRTGLLELKKTDLPVRIYTDSSYALGLLTKGWKPKKNIELVEETRSILKKFKDIKFIKVEGHAGIEGNERADTLATSAIKRQQ